MELVIWGLAILFVAAAITVRNTRKPTPMPEWMEKAEEQIRLQRQRARIVYNEFEVKATYNRAAGDRHGDRKQAKHVFMVRRQG
jgi:hypothetical protein